MNEKLDTPIAFLKSVGPVKAELLQKELHIFTYRDLLFHFPFRYIDRTRFHQIKEIGRDGNFVQLKGRLKGFRALGKPRQRRLSAILEDEAGSIELVWFKGVAWMEKYLKPGAEYTVFGKPNFFNGKFSIPHPELELAGSASPERSLHLHPVYPSTEKLRTRGLDSKGLQKLTKLLIHELDANDLLEVLPDTVVQSEQLVNRNLALKTLHFPKDTHSLQLARMRMKFEELFVVQVGLQVLKLYRKREANANVFEKIDGIFDRFYNEKLGFELTGAQKKVLREIRWDVKSGWQMNRLLQGDVGSGKTIVALMAMLMAVDNGFQACIMAPTEILARQHMESVSEMMEGLGVKTAILTGSVKGKERKQLLAALEAGVINLLIGTHALIEDKVIFAKLALIVIDEQHRFGVAQRARLWAKSTRPPHILVMTATPIPRTLAMTLYGDLDYSVIDELPPGRKAVKTVHRKDSQRLAVFGFIKDEIAKGRQVYIVYPLIQESANMDYKDLEDGYESIKRAFPSPDYEVSIVHGRMKAADKDIEMQRFVNKKTQIMVATTVIEVGVNVPNASLMIIESSERFGLAQLHQLRGRVGRGAEQSYCILMSGEKISNDARTRLKTMCETNDGFRISEVDMNLRGPGDMQGTRQSGAIDLRIANLLEDGVILDRAKVAATAVLEDDPTLIKESNLSLRLTLKKAQYLQGDWSKIS